MKCRGAAGLIVVLASLCAPSIADAASVGVAVSADPLEDRAITFTSQADTGGADLKVYAKYRVDDGNPCGLKFTADPGTSLFTGVAGNTAEQKTLDDPGPYVICSWLQQSITSDTDIRGVTRMTVRPNAATIAIQVPPSGTTGVGTPVTITGTTEIGRQLYARMKPAGAGPCGQSYDADPTTVAGNFAFGIGLTGAFSVPRLTGSVRDAGPYTICAWVQERSNDPVAEAVASVPLNVLPPRPLPSELNFADTSFAAVPFGGSRTTSYRGGTNITFTLNTPATARFTVHRRVGRRYKRVKGSFTIPAKQGYNSFRFSGRVGGRTLKRGRYRMTMSTQNAAGKGTVRRKVFRITRRP